MGVVVGDQIFPLDHSVYPDMTRFLIAGSAAQAEAEKIARGESTPHSEHRLCDVALLPPVTRPGKIIAVGLKYANNVLFETTVFDVKIIFGEISQPYGEKPFVEQRAATTLSWREAKIAALLLTMNVAMHENLFGVMEIPEGNLPEGFQHTPEDRKLALLKMMEFVGSRPPVKPNVPSAETKQ